jgi:hypothetical protein
VEFRVLMLSKVSLSLSVMLLARSKIERVVGFFLSLEEPTGEDKAENWERAVAVVAMVAFGRAFGRGCGDLTVYYESVILVVSVDFGRLDAVFTLWC